jgi:4-amino-4-deoxy-L-arabinose transferase-like glycosyltransferase
MNLLGLSVLALAGIGFCLLGKYIHKDNHKNSRNFGAFLIFVGAVMLAATAFGDWMHKIGRIGGVIALLILIFCGWVIWRDIKVDKKDDGRAALALFLLPFVFSLGVAQIKPVSHTVGDQMKSKFNTEQLAR